MDYSKFRDGEIEPLYNLNKPYHSEIIVLQGAFFIFLKTRCVLSGELMLSLSRQRGHAGMLVVPLDPHSTESPPLGRPGRCGFSAVTWNRALVKMKQCLK